MAFETVSFFKKSRFPPFVLPFLLLAFVAFLFLHFDSPPPYLIFIRSYFFNSTAVTVSSLGPGPGPGPVVTTYNSPSQFVGDLRSPPPPPPFSVVDDDHDDASSNNITTSLDINWRSCRGAVAVDYIPCLDNWNVIKALRSRRHMEHRERHCPKPSPRCLVPLPSGYKTPVPWPKSRDMVRLILLCW